MTGSNRELLLTSSLREPQVVEETPERGRPRVYLNLRSNERATMPPKDYGVLSRRSIIRKGLARANIREDTGGFVIGGQEEAKAAATKPAATRCGKVGSEPSGEVQPRALLQRLPRIANALARLWQDDVRLRFYLDDLLVDRRGGRHGFPPEILNELLVLREYCEGRYPEAPPSA